ncbi:MAG: PfkB family carbohydrate kinase [Rhizobiaceae bacterium]
MTIGMIFVVGSLHYDIVVDAPKLPSLDETVMGGPMRFVCGGKGGNQAVAASLHGAGVHFGGIVGHDRFGDALIENLRKCGVDCSQVIRSNDAVSGASVAIIDKDGGYGAVVASGANQSIAADDFVIPDETEILVLQNEIPERACFGLAEKARSAGVKIVLNAAPWRRFETKILEVADILVVNRVEASGMFGDQIDSVDQSLTSLRDRPIPLGCAVITLGDDGLVFADDGGEPEYLPSFDVPVISTHGAGDAFVGAMCAELLLGSATNGALAYASAAAALHVSTPVENRLSIDRDQTLAFMASAHLRS